MTKIQIGTRYIIYFIKGERGRYTILNILKYYNIILCSCIVIVLYYLKVFISSINIFLKKILLTACNSFSLSLIIIGINK